MVSIRVTMLDIAKGRTYALRPIPGAMPTGKFARAPIKIEASADMAAVEVIRSCFTSWTH